MHSIIAAVAPEDVPTLGDLIIQSAIVVVLLIAVWIMVRIDRADQRREDRRHR